MGGTDILNQNRNYEGFKSSLPTSNEPKNKTTLTIAAMVATYEGETNAYHPPKAAWDLVFK